MLHLHQPYIVRTVSQLRQLVRNWRAAGANIGLVPTMGCLHAGHLSLIDRCQGLADRTVVSIFVNPTQFGPNEDFKTYPRDETRDLEMLGDRGVDVAYCPAPEEMYRPGEVTRVTVPGLGDILEGAYRPGFFTGVATVVLKLFNQCGPDLAVFGEKDYQQLLIIRRMVADLDLPVRIEAVATHRQPDGLATSSRNVYLSSGQRKAATALSRAISGLAGELQSEADHDGLIRAARQRIIAAGFDSVDYLEVVDGQTLGPLQAGSAPARVLAAAGIGGVRLIDNIAVEGSGSET